MNLTLGQLILGLDLDLDLKAQQRLNLNIAEKYIS